jgi:hypothetical protein
LSIASSSFSNALFKLRRLDDFGERLHHFCQLCGSAGVSSPCPTALTRAPMAGTALVELFQLRQVKGYGLS